MTTYPDEWLKGRMIRGETGSIKVVYADRCWRNHRPGKTASAQCDRGIVSKLTGLCGFHRMEMQDW